MLPSMLSWSDLAARTLARQFPVEVEPGDVQGLMARVGPIQSQTARSVFLGVAARLPGVTREQLTAAYESSQIVRGSTLRGTVHTSTAAQHPLLEVATRQGQRALWARTLKPSEATLEQIWASIENYAGPRWRTPAELAEHLLAWLTEHDPDAAPAFAGTSGRYFAFGHGGLLRRPVKGDWSGQERPSIGRRLRCWATPSGGSARSPPRTTPSTPCSGNSSRTPARSAGTTWPGGQESG